MGKYYILILFKDGDEIIITPTQFTDMPETTQALFYEYRRSNITHVTSTNYPEMYNILSKMKLTHPRDYVDNLMMKSIICIDVCN